MRTSDRVIKAFLQLSTVSSVLITVLIVLSVFSETMRFFSHVSLFNFFFGLEWSPQTAIRADQAGGSGSFGAVPIFVGTVMIAAIAMAVATPLGLLAAIYLSVYATPRFRNAAKPVLPGKNLYRQNGYSFHIECAARGMDLTR